MERAKELFRQGNELRKAGDCLRALEFFVKSRALVPSVPNILNGAYCLNALGRHDEALEHYEVLLTRHSKDLRSEELSEIQRTMAVLRKQVARLDVSANLTGAQLVIDGRPRGQLPLLGPVRVLPGEHRVMIAKDGYRSYSTRVRVSAGQLRSVVGRLEPLRLSGQLHITAAELAGAEVIVDGAPVGTAPWRGQLSPGHHVVVLRRGDRGTAPTRLTVVKGQIASPLLTLIAPWPAGSHWRHTLCRRAQHQCGPSRREPLRWTLATGSSSALGPS